MNEQDNELALRIAREAGMPMDDGSLDDGEIDLVVGMFNRFHSTKLEQYGKGFEEWRKSQFTEQNYGAWHEAKRGWDACAASREPEIQALRERIAVMDGAGQEQAAEIQALREEVDRLKAERDQYKRAYEHQLYD